MSESALRQAAGDLAPRMAALREEIGARLAALPGQASAALERAGRLRRGAVPPVLEAPPSFAEMLAAAMAMEERDAAAGDPGAAARRRTLEVLYLEIMPGQRLEQRLLGGGPEERLLHAPLDWAQLPALRGALARLRGLLGLPWEGDIEVAAPTVCALYERAYYGRYLPLLYGAAPDLLRLDARLAQAPLASVIDRDLCAPLVHELSHAVRDRPALPPYLDECVASYLGVRALRALAFPPLDAAEAPRSLYAAPWLSQVGQALARAMAGGAEALAAAQAGRARFDAALPGLERAAARLGLEEYAARRAPHFLSSARAPAPWLKLPFLAAAGADLDGLTLAGLAALPWAEVPVGPEDERDCEILRDALCAACLTHRPDDPAAGGGPAPGALVVEAAAPAAPIRLDLSACVVRAAPGEEDAGYLFPPALAARLRARGVAGYTLTIDGPLRESLLDELVARLRDGGAPGRGAGYELSRHLV